MAEIDYQMALLLQYQYEQELRKPKEYKSDVELAKALQKQFETEYRIDRPGPELVYDNKKVADSSKCLTDPSWEIIDPTPDIHILFMAFNERFFWNKLLSVCVSWSKRMTTCAGVCAYHGKGGMCCITLSEPLLKLRPRKDLVETLLHEMIHAYLFVTHNNKDRDGHGPEFHKHMYRINGEAGTNITVYHNFHDEVQLYQQHWWRCDGPCQKWKPYFGIVRRAMNRAPGPQDRWWAEHSRNCGGNFAKVKEPEKPQAKSATKENVKPKEDIRNFIPSLKITGTTKNMPTTSSAGNNKILSNVHTIISTDNNNSTKLGGPKANNIFGFTDLNGTSCTNSSKGTPSNCGKGNVSGAVKNNSNTIVINKKPSTITQSDLDPTAEPYIPRSFGIGRILSDSTLANRSSDYSIVRNHWLTKFTNNNNNPKRSLPQTSPGDPKIPKLSPNTTSPVRTPPKNIEMAECPVCVKQVALIELNDHLDGCLDASKDADEKECIICGKKIPAAEYELHVGKCSEDEGKKSETKCSSCGKNIATENYDAHIGICSQNGIVDSATCKNLERKQCAVCDQMVASAVYDSHMEKCLLKMYDDMEASYGNQEEKVDCLACGMKILKSTLNSHLDDCMSLSGVFEYDNKAKDEQGRTARNSEVDTKYNCPFCMGLVLANEMSSHIDICLNMVDPSPQVESDKCVLIDSLVEPISDGSF